MLKVRKSHPQLVRYQRLILEIFGLIAIIIIILAIRFLPWLFAQPVPIDNNPYRDYQKLFNDVSTYDYSRGPDTSLERRIERGTTNLSSDASPVQLYYNLKAKGEYYMRTGRYETAITAYREALYQVPDSETLSEEYAYLYDALAKCYRSVGDYEQAQKYQANSNNQTE